MEIQSVAIVDTLTKAFAVRLGYILHLLISFLSLRIMAEI